MSEANAPTKVSTLKAMRRSFSLRSSLAAPFLTGSLRSRRKLSSFWEKDAELVTPNKDVKVKDEYREKDIAHVHQDIAGEHKHEKGGDLESGNLNHVEERNGNIVEAKNSVEANENNKPDNDNLFENDYVGTDSASQDLTVEKTVDKTAEVEVDVAVAVEVPSTLQASHHPSVQQQDTAPDDANDIDINGPNSSTRLESTVKSNDSDTNGDEEPNLISSSQAQPIVISTSDDPVTPPPPPTNSPTPSSSNISDPGADADQNADPDADPFTEPDADPFYIPNSTINLPSNDLDHPLPLGHNPLFNLSLSLSHSPPESNIEEAYFATPISRLNLSSNPGFNRSNHLANQKQCTMANYAAEVDRRIVANSDMRDFAYEPSDKFHRKAYGHPDGERDWVDVEGLD
ncbi:hypothetical protein ABEF92_003651 [Exophiala dermatitidis]|uniref:Uncharacterized protein n=1 Tax=Exophiala dermatitidis (strain ATCC 34100 / CBS 525.76 / NIH/UT8656) TaxID=858893 RepID=H6BRB2_EXODN|nr:uncharacterized protein HMPREF1120_02858 [Exophiala dermatitidis NIH/UT8656]EHY54693.1 hypothetical protein HMPREF1120_02858 [Exophiala dermatitidis NIH/UT8656]